MNKSILLVCVIQSNSEGRKEHYFFEKRMVSRSDSFTKFMAGMSLPIFLFELVLLLVEYFFFEVIILRERLSPYKPHALLFDLLIIVVILILTPKLIFNVNPINFLLKICMNMFNETKTILCMHLNF